jgi:drug/metabolite transporter (DMT)-like permease
VSSTAGVRPEHHLRGILLIIAAVSTFALLDTTAKYLAQSYPVPGVVWVRYACQTLFTLLALGPRLQFDLVRTRRPGLQFARGVALALSSLLFCSALAVMPIAEASAITFLAPLLLTAMSAVILKERVRPSAWIAVIGGFVGVLFIVRPGGAAFTPAALFAVGAAFCFAAYQLLTRKLAGVDSTLATLFLGGLIGTVLMAVVLPFYWQAPATWFDASLFAALGVLGGVGHFILIRAFEHAPPSVLAPFVYLQLVAVLLLGLAVFGQFPDYWSLVGMAIIVVSGAWVAARRA